MLKLSDLADKPDFTAGPLRISPARRLVEGPSGTASVEPIVMKVFLLLIDAAGSVVTRDELFANAWGGVFVGDDSLNRAIARVRKIAADSAPDLFEIETIPRTGYRLRGRILDELGERTGIESADGAPRGLSRRAVAASVGGVLLAGIAGAGLWSVRSRDGRRFDDLVERAREALDYGEGSAVPMKYLEQAVAIRPNDATAQGLLAFSLMGYVSNVNKAGPGTDVDRADQAVRAALRLDPDEPNARLAQIMLHQATLDLAATEDRLRAVLATAPDNIYAMRLLWSLLQCAGRSRDALALVQRAIAVKPLAASNNYPLAQLLWITGRTAEADRIIDRAMQFWPNHRYVRFARFTISAFTGRARAALAMLDSDSTRPQTFPPDSIALWHVSLPALDQPSPANIAHALRANLDAARRNPGLTSQAVLVLSALGEVDAAFDIANDLLVFRDPAASSTKEAAGRPSPTSNAWRFTPWVFTPPAAAMRADSRFAALCDGIGLTAYWTKRGIKPDFERV